MVRDEGIPEEPAEATSASGGQPASDAEEAETAPPAVTLSYSEYEELRTLARERDEFLRRLQRAVADYQNLQKRIERSRESAQEVAVRALAEEMLPLADGLARALEAARWTKGAQPVVDGLVLVEREFYAALAKFGVRPIKAVGQRFDPQWHEAVMQEVVPDAPANTVVREVKKGFLLGEAVLRPAQVVVTPNSRLEPGVEPEDGVT